jgi:hypothetical protein
LVEHPLVNQPFELALYSCGDRQGASVVKVKEFCPLGIETVGLFFPAVDKENESHKKGSTTRGGSNMTKVLKDGKHIATIHGKVNVNLIAQFFIKGGKVA